MASVNKVILIGGLTRDVEVRYSAQGAAIANLDIGTTRRWKDRDTNEWKEEKEYHRVVLFGRLAEIAGEYLRKGSQVYIEGRLRTRKWQDKEGQDRYTTEIVGEIMQMLGGREGGGSSDTSYEGGYQSQQQQPRPTQDGYERIKGKPARPMPKSDFSDMDDDIPW